eukprot:1160285-Pelagomonas_calceolata.AAC.7
MRRCAGHELFWTALPFRSGPDRRQGMDCGSQPCWGPSLAEGACQACSKVLVVGYSVVRRGYITLYWMEWREECIEVRHPLAFNTLNS